ncbi:MAG: STAS domain-containing protein [Calditrichaceae bacterium]
MNPMLNINQTSEHNVVILSLSGKLVGQNEIEQLYFQIRQLQENKINRIVLNLEQLDWMGSLGLGALISCMTTLRNIGGDVHLCNLNPKLKSLLKITRLELVMPVFESTDMAIQSFFNTAKN